MNPARPQIVVANAKNVRDLQELIGEWWGGEDLGSGELIHDRCVRVARSRRRALVADWKGHGRGAAVDVKDVLNGQNGAVLSPGYACTDLFKD
jgi:hypothetical protein